MPPIHANIMDSAIAAGTRGSPQGCPEEIDKVLTAEFARCHGELGMLDMAAPDDVPNAQIVRRIEKRHRGAASAHQGVEIRGLARVATKDAMVTELPQVTRLAHDVGGEPLRFHTVG